MPRTLLLCFVHGFKGDEDTFRTFPGDLKTAVAELLADQGDRVETVVYPRYETRGELAVASQQFLAWLRARVVDVRNEQNERNEHAATPGSSLDRDVGVVLVAHSMGGFIAADALFLALDERRAAGGEPEGAERQQETGDGNVPASSRLSPPIQGLLALDTPYNGLSRSLFVYGALSHCSKAHAAFHVATALSAGPLALGRLALRRARKPSAAAWKAGQLMAVRAGAIGALAAGGVVAYVHRRSIRADVERVRRIDRQSLRQGCQMGVDAIRTYGQGLARVSRRNVSASFAWLAAHGTFVGALLKPTELQRRLQRLAEMRGGMGVHNLYVSLGANGYWSGGYFVPERTFCAVPEDSAAEGRQADQAGPSAAASLASLFERWTMRSCDDEVQAHRGMFTRDKNADYDAMTRRSAELVASWFANNEPLVDPLGTMKNTGREPGGNRAQEDSFPRELPTGIAAMASLHRRPAETAETAEKGGSIASAIVIDDDDDGGEDGSWTAAIPEHGRSSYVHHLLAVARNAGTGAKRVSEWSSQLPAKMPRVDRLSMLAMPALQCEGASSAASVSTSMSDRAKAKTAVCPEPSCGAPRLAIATDAAGQVDATGETASGLEDKGGDGTDGT